MRALRYWLAEPRAALIAAIADGVRTHVETLRSRGVEFYGYALLPGEPYDIHSLVAVTNADADIKVPTSDEEYRYYRYSVDEWTRWEHDEFGAANALLVEANQKFRSIHSKIDDNIQMDEYEVAHANALLEAVVCGLEAAKAAGTFGGVVPFLVVWISDSGHEIMAQSVRRLNTPAVIKEYLAEFG